jgi:glutathione S-transferase
MTLTLYYSPGACSLAPHICLEEAGAVAEYIRVDLAGGEQHGPAYRRLNANGRVPLLVTEQGALSEAAAIMGWIARTWPEARLTPDDAWGQAQVDSFNSFLTSSVHASSFGAVFRPARFSDDAALHPQIKARGLATLREQLGLIDARLAPGRWVHGAYSTSDPYLLVMTRWWVRLGEDLSAFPQIADHAGRMLERPAVRRAFESEGITFGPG